MLAEKTGSSVADVLQWDDDHFAIAQAAFSALEAKRDSKTGGPGAGGPPP